MPAFNDIAVCPYCQSDNLKRLTGTEEPTRHYGRLICGDCNRWIAWLQDPFTTLQWQARAKAIDVILCAHTTTNWERGFLESVREQRVLTVKQQDRLNAISLKYRGFQICVTDGMPPPPLPLSSKNPVPSGRGVVA